MLDLHVTPFPCRCHRLCAAQCLQLHFPSPAHRLTAAITSIKVWGIFAVNPIWPARALKSQQKGSHSLIWGLGAQAKALPGRQIETFRAMAMQSM